MTCSRFPRFFPIIPAAFLTAHSPHHRAASCPDGEGPAQRSRLPKLPRVLNREPGPRALRSTEAGLARSPISPLYSILFPLFCVPTLVRIPPLLVVWFAENHLTYTCHSPLAYEMGSHSVLLLGSLGGYKV